MMNNYKKLLPLIAAIIMITIGGCNKTDDSKTDLTTDAVGHYTSGSGSGKVDIYVTRIDNNTISVAVDPACCSGFTFGDATMTTSTAFNLGTATGNSNGYTATYTGTGSYSANVITLIVHERGTDSQGALIYEDDDTYNGTK